MASVVSATSGVSIRQTVSLTRKAESRPETSTTPTSSKAGRWACSPTQAAASWKKPARRRWATMIIMPSSSVSVSMSTAL